jgi:hypothetical protein
MNPESISDLSLCHDIALDKQDDSHAFIRAFLP